MFWRNLKPIKIEYYPATILNILSTQFTLNLKYEKVLLKKSKCDCLSDFSCNLVVHRNPRDT